MPFRIYFYAFTVLLLLSCKNPQHSADIDSKEATLKKSWHLIDSSKQLLNDGDLILRSDDDLESLSIQNLSKKEKIYSHSGIVFKETDSFFVYNAIAGKDNPTEKLKREPYDSFLNPNKKTGFGIFRYNLSATENDHLHKIYQQYFLSRLPFDKSFNLQSDDSMYCSEIIYKSLRKATNNRITLPISILNNYKAKMPSSRFKNILFKKFEYIGLDDLYLNPFCTSIFQAVY